MLDSISVANIVNFDGSVPIGRVSSSSPFAIPLEEERNDRLLIPSSVVFSDLNIRDCFRRVFGEVVLADYVG